MSTQATESIVTAEGFRTQCEGVLEYAIKQGKATIHAVADSTGLETLVQTYETPAGVVISRIGEAALIVECDYSELGGASDITTVEYGGNRQLPPQINNTWMDSEGGRFSKTIKQDEAPEVLAQLAKYVTLIV